MLAKRSYIVEIDSLFSLCMYYAICRYLVNRLHENIATTPELQDDKLELLINSVCISVYKQHNDNQIAIQFLYIVQAKF